MRRPKRRVINLAGCCIKEHAAHFNRTQSKHKTALLSNQDVSVQTHKKCPSDKKQVSYQRTDNVLQGFRYD